MRTTKALLCAAALAAGAVTSMAQSNVYSLNVVGYINLTLTNGYNLIANQLDVDGYMTNNTLSTVLGTNLPNLTKVWTYDPASGSYSFATFFTSTHAWSGNTAAANAALAPGKGLFVQIPAAASYPQTVTLVGNVIQGTNVMPVATGYQNVSIVPPVSAGIQTGMGYKPTNLDKVWVWNPVTQSYGFKTYFSSTGTWSGGEPTPNVGESFFLQAKVDTNWVQSFNVQ